MGLWDPPGAGPPRSSRRNAHRMHAPSHAGKPPGATPAGSADQLHPLSTRRKAVAVPTAHARGSAPGSRVATRPRGAAPANQRGPGRGFSPVLRGRRRGLPAINLLLAVRWEPRASALRAGTEAVRAPGGDGDPRLLARPAPGRVGAPPCAGWGTEAVLSRAPAASPAAAHPRALRSLPRAPP